jgi:hypothetical protein
MNKSSNSEPGGQSGEIRETLLLGFNLSQRENLINNVIIDI